MLSNPQNSSINLNDFSSNVFSQHGEDGILGKLFETLGLDRGYFCEFGAWDGMHLSNSYQFWKRGWNGCYIEGNTRRYKQLLANTARDGVTCVNAYVRQTGDDSLDDILTRVNSNSRRVDLLSIDIDSDDLAIWRSLRRFRASVVVIEYNPTIPCDILFENTPGKNYGNSCRSIFDFATHSGYVLVAATATNLIFLDSNLNQGRFQTFQLLSPELRLGYRYFFGMDGTLFRTFVGSKKVDDREFFNVPWSRAIFSQPIPRALRRFDRGFWVRRMVVVGSFASALVRRPISFVLFALKGVAKRLGSA